MDDPVTKHIDAAIDAANSALRAAARAEESAGQLDKALARAKMLPVYAALAALIGYSGAELLIWWFTK